MFRKNTERYMFSLYIHLSIYTLYNIYMLHVYRHRNPIGRAGDWLYDSRTEQLLLSVMELSWNWIASASWNLHLSRFLDFCLERLRCCLWRVSGQLHSTSKYVRMKNAQCWCYATSTEAVSPEHWGCPALSCTGKQCQC